MLTKQQAEALTKKVLSFSKLDDCSVRVVETHQSWVRFANNGITTAGSALSRSVEVSSTRDTKTGTSETSEITEAALRAVVAKSEEVAALSPPNTEYMPPLGPQQYQALPDLDANTASSSQAMKAQQVKAAIEVAQQKKLIIAGFLQRATIATAFANKKGLFGFNLTADSGLSTTVRTPDGSSSGWASHPSVHISEIDGAAVARLASDKCERWKNPRRMEPGKYTVILEATAASDLLTTIGQGFNARNADEGRSFLTKKGGGTLAGEKLFPDNVTLVSDPFDPRRPASPWTGDGLPNERIAWIENGVVKNLSYTRYWASKTQKQPTPPAGNLVLTGGDATLEELIRGTQRGLLVTRLWYIRSVNPQTVQMTGLTRDGLFLVENGQIAGPVMNFRFNESPVRLLQNLRRLGKQQRVRGGEGAGMIAPPLVADDFTFASVSDAV